MDIPAFEDKIDIILSYNLVFPAGSFLHGITLNLPYILVGIKDGFQAE
jgi:hypothetical protein